MSDKQM